MKRFLAVCVITLSLGGCAALQNVTTAVQVATASVANPVTKERLFKLESAVILVFSGLNTWKKACRDDLINASCKGQIAAVQVYTRKIPPYLVQLRVFVRDNDQVNAVVLYNNIMDLVASAKAQAAQADVPLGS